MLYSFCRTCVICLGWMLPWQLLLAQPPGPLYLPAGLFWAATTVAKARHTTAGHAGFGVLPMALGDERIPRVIVADWPCLYPFWRAESIDSLVRGKHVSTGPIVSAGVPRLVFPRVNLEREDSFQISSTIIRT